jgi:hypothetical protein
LKRLTFFPTPYPDEMLYGVLCRYHARYGNSSTRQTNLALWGNIYGKKLFLPDGIERIAAQIPQGANLTAERFINENTIFPLLKPFLTQDKCDALSIAMKFGDRNIYNILGFSRVFILQHHRLRYCPRCVENDTEMYGEPYWHRVHQLPGVYICPIHDSATVESDTEFDKLRYEYYPLVSATSKSVLSYGQDTIAKLSDFARDAAWLLQHGCALDCSEHTDELYDNWLRVKGYRDKGGKTSGKRLAQNIVGYYGREFLALFDAYNSGACTRIRRIIQNKTFQHPLHHMLLIRFVAGSPEVFFAGTQAEATAYLPYGLPPYPCRNVICEYHLWDVIGNVEIMHTAKGAYKALFICPHCGFTYRRKRPLPKEKQYAGQIDIVAYGRKWEQAVTKLLTERKSPYKIAHEVHCDVRTILAFGVERNLLSIERYMKRNPYVPAESPQEKPDVSSQRELYRQRWLYAIAANPGITRNELRRLDSTADQWLHRHDADWLEQNSPPSKHRLPKWADCDDEYLERIENAVKQIRDPPGIPRRLSLAAIGREAGISKPHVRLTSDLLPKTKAFVAAHTETHEQWQKRKILWVIRQLRGCGELLTVYKVRHAANIEDRERKLDGFILEGIEKSE